MPAKARITTLLFILCLTMVCLQGCTVSEDAGAPSISADTRNLALSTSTGSTLLVADGASSVPVQITVTNGVGQGIANTAVTFTTNAGSLAAPTGTTAARDADAGTTRADGDSVTVTTDANGVAQATLTASNTIETARITATIVTTGESVSLQVNFVSGIPAQVALTAVPAIVGVGDTTTVQATVTTADDTPVEGITVTLAVSVNNSGAGLAPTSGTTDANGQVSAVYTAGTFISTDTVRAQVSGDIFSTVAITVQASTVQADSLVLLVSSPQLDSDDSETVTLTALVRDANNNFVSNVPVTFTADSGGIQVTNGTTDASGAATALLSAAGDPTNRTITVTAIVTAVPASSNSVNVTGTTVTLSGVSSLVLGETAALSILLRDSGGNGIANQAVALSSDAGNTFSTATVTTDVNGQATVNVTAAVAGDDTIQAAALGATGTAALTVSSANFVFNTPAANTEVSLGAVQTVTVHWDEAGVNQAGQTINFFATRGTLSAASAITDASGNATVTISSTNAGPAVVTAAATTSGGPSSQVSIEFVATTPTSLILQANFTSLSVNAEGSTDQQSIVTAIVRDANGNLVKNQTVSFTLTDVRGGSIFPASAITDSFGRASTVYTAGSAASAQDGVIIDAEVAGTVGCVPTAAIPTGPCDRVTLTVGQQALFIRLGTGNLVQGLSDTQYAKTYSALVTDTNGNPIAGADVELNVFPTRYQKGVYVQFFSAGVFVVWVKSLTINAASGFADDVDQACDNEDINRNGLLETGEDINASGALEPGNVVAVPIRVTTDDTGFASFDLVYAREFTWVEVTLEAITTVGGSEARTTATFFLPGLASDFTQEDVSPPGAVSAFGTSTTCADPT